MVQYRCSDCKTPLEMDLETMGLTCRHCGNKIFYKSRPSVKKTVTSE